VTIGTKGILPLRGKPEAGASADDFDFAALSGNGGASHFVPHLMQNFAESPFWAPQFAQNFMRPPHRMTLN
jgi:hypothetical protein